MDHCGTAHLKNSTHYEELPAWRYLQKTQESFGRDAEAGEDDVWEEKHSLVQFPK